ncbi:hypothetical protein L9G74_01835 [Shewanella sp. C32]|uniref:RhsPI domain-containing protein n=1 Tax=Shewanella electrica TaxID=515560 RepID=A0ABT2FFV1_9GAMM|nr:hypothetical protein [Shewanella electrica]MCH1925345.1 hypothetical protein [Shewanella electrica]MCS4555170.1 hypothetical protein [Shewanella electrica]
MPSTEPQAAQLPAIPASDVNAAVAHFIPGSAYCIAQSFSDSHGNSWLSAGLLHFCGSEFTANEQRLTLHFNEDDAPLSLTLALDDVAQRQVLQQFDVYLPLAFTLNDALIKQLTPLWQAAQQPTKPLQVADFAELQATIPDTELLFTEVFLQDELATIAARFAPFLYHVHYLPIISSDYEQLIVLGYGAENAGQVAYFDFDFGLCPLNCDLPQLLQQLRA